MNGHIRDYAKAMTVIEQIILNSNAPLCAADLFDKPDVRAVTENRDDVSKIASTLYKGKRVGRVPFAHPVYKTTKYAYVGNAASRAGDPAQRRIVQSAKRAAGAAPKSKAEVVIKCQVDEVPYEFAMSVAKELYRQLRDVFK